MHNRSKSKRRSWASKPRKGRCHPYRSQCHYDGMHTNFQSATAFLICFTSDVRTLNHYPTSIFDILPALLTAHHCCHWCPPNHPKPAFTTGRRWPAVTFLHRLTLRFRNIRHGGGRGQGCCSSGLLSRCKSFRWHRLAAPLLVIAVDLFLLHAARSRSFCFCHRALTRCCCFYCAEKMPRTVVALPWRARCSGAFTGTA